MPGFQLRPAGPSSTMKRPAPNHLDVFDEPRPTKRVKHSIKYTQPHVEEILAGALDEEVFHQQLQQAVLLALSAAGFDAAEPAALHMFCSLADECTSLLEERRKKRRC